MACAHLAHDSFYLVASASCFFLLVLIGLFYQSSFKGDKDNKRLVKYLNDIEIFCVGRMSSEELSKALEENNDALIDEIFQETVSRTRTVVDREIQRKISEIELWYGKELSKFAKQQWRRSEAKKIQNGPFLPSIPEKGWLLDAIQEEFLQATDHLEDWRLALSDLATYRRENSGSWGFLKGFAVGALGGAQIAGGVVALGAGNFLGGLKALGSGGQKLFSSISSGDKISNQYVQSCTVMHGSITGLLDQIEDACVAGWEKDTKQISDQVSQLENQMLQPQSEQQPQPQDAEPENASEAASQMPKESLETMSA